jgi:hypothetical protein
MEAETDFPSSRQDPLTITNFNQDEALQHPSPRTYLLQYSERIKIFRYWLIGQPHLCEALRFSVRDCSPG